MPETPCAHDWAPLAGVRHDCPACGRDTDLQACTCCGAVRMAAHADPATGGRRREPQPCEGSHTDLAPLHPMRLTRHRLALTQAQLATHLGVRERTISRIEQASVPLDVLYGLALEGLEARLVAAPTPSCVSGPRAQDSGHGNTA